MNYLEHRNEALAINPELKREYDALGAEYELISDLVLARIERKVSQEERTPARVNKTVNRLKQKIVERSSGLIPEETAENLAFRCVARMDFNNPIQMHRSLESFADGIIASYFRSRGMA